MNKYDIISFDNREQINGYVKIGSFPLRPVELSNYNFPSNNNNIILDIFWNGASGQGKHAQFSIALKTSTTLNISQLSMNLKNEIPSKPLAYVRTDDSFEIYVKSFTEINPFLNVKCCILETFESRFIPETGNPFKDISSLNPTYFDEITLNVLNSSISNCNIKNLINNSFFIGEKSSYSFSLPDYDPNKKYIINLFNVRNGILKELSILIFNGNIHVVKKDDSNLNASFDNNQITLTGLEYYSHVYYIFSHF